MSATVTKLPTAAVTYYEVKEGGRGVWRCTLVTPIGNSRKSLRTILCKSTSFEAVKRHALEAGARTHRPVKVVGAPL